MEWLGYYVLVNFLVELFALFYAYQWKTSNHWIYNILTTCQISWIALHYARHIADRKASGSIRILNLVFLTVVATNLLFVQGVKNFHTYAYIIGCIFIFYISFLYLRGLLQDMEMPPLKSVPFFWVTIGNIIYFICSMFYLGSINYILDSHFDEYGTLINLFVYLFTALQFVFFSIAFMCNQVPKVK